MTLVHASVWELVLRRDPASRSLEEQIIVSAWSKLVSTGSAVMIGTIRQEVLSGVSDEKRFLLLKAHIDSMHHIETSKEEHYLAAELFNRCASSGIRVAAADILVCAAARTHRLPLFTLDQEFERIAPLVEIDLWRVTSVH